MKDMIRLYGPYVVIAPGAALLHAGPEMGAKRLAMSLVVLRDPVPFGHEFHDPVRLALAFSSVDHKTHVRAVGEAVELLRATDRRQSIHEASSEQEILESIRLLL
jgi:PTS system ascorbate-specific IIA component